MSINNLKALSENKFYFSTGSYFNDPFDCTDDNPVNYITADDVFNYLKNKYPDITESQHAKTTESTLCNFQKKASEGFKDCEDSQFLIESIFDYITNSFIYSLSEISHNSLMWSHYADSHKGFCIRFKKDIFLNQEFIRTKKPVDYSKKLPSLGKVLLSSVEQNQKPTDVDIYSLADEAICHKSSDWAYEEEFRITHRKLSERSVGLQPETYPEDSVDMIIFGLKTSQSDIDLVKTMLKGRDIKYKRVEIGKGGGYSLYATADC